MSLSPSGKLLSPRPLVFPVTLTEAASGTVKVDYTTVDGTGTNAAIQPEDYTTKSGTLTFAAGVLEQDITVPIAADNWQASDETFQVLLSNPQGGVPIRRGTATGTIEQGPPPVMSIANATVGEGGTETFTVTLSAPSAGTTTAYYSTANGSAVAGTDYTAVTNGPVTILPGATSTTVTVATRDDNYGNESDEQFYVNLSSAVGATLGTSQAVGTITEDADATPTISIADASGLESAGSLTFDVSLSEASAVPITVQYTTADGSGTYAATSSEDYSATSGTVTFPSGRDEPNGLGAAHKRLVAAGR